MNNRRSFIVGLKTTNLSTKEKIFLRKYKPWGVILFTRNIKNKVKIKSFYVQTASLAKKELVATEWSRIQKKYNLNVKNLIFITEKTKLKNNQIFYRLSVGKFESNADAKSFCKKLNFNKSCIIKIIKE